MDQKKIGRFIAYNRKLNKITQVELADRLGVSDRSISNWENGKNMPDLSLFKPLCDILGITINELLSGEKINNSQYSYKLEENFINTIDYIDKKNNKHNNLKSICFFVVAIVGLCLARVIFNDEVEKYLTVICMVLAVYSIKQLFIRYRLVRRIVAIFLLIICFVALFLNY